MHRFGMTRRTAVLAMVFGMALAACGSTSNTPPPAGGGSGPFDGPVTAPSAAANASSGPSTFGAEVHVTDVQGFTWLVSAGPLQTSTTVTDTTNPGQPTHVAPPGSEYVSVQIRWTNAASQVEPSPADAMEFAIPDPKYSQFVSNPSVLGCDSLDLPNGVCRLSSLLPVDTIVSMVPSPPPVGDTLIQPGHAETDVIAIGPVHSSASVAELEVFLDLRFNDRPETQVPLAEG